MLRIRRGRSGKFATSWNSRNLSRYADVERDVAMPREGKRCQAMGFGLRSAAVALALTSASLVSSPVWAGDDGAAPLWQGIGGIFASGCWIYWPWWRGKAASDRLSRTRQARPAAEYGIAAARLLRRRGSLLARESGDRAQEGAKGRGKEKRSPGWAMRVCAIRTHSRRTSP